MRLISLFVLLCCNLHASAQSYADTIARHRSAYKKEFVTDAHSPLRAEDTLYLRFFWPNERYRVVAKFKATPEATPFQMPTHSGKAKTYRKYGVLSFRLLGAEYHLEVYQSPELIKREELKDHLFVPFNDISNYEETYGGGRYLDLSLKDIVDNTVVLDFNKAYNPYCAYAAGYNCPIPPEANRLPIKILAGEKTFGKKADE